VDHPRLDSVTYHVDAEHIDATAQWLAKVFGAPDVETLGEQVRSLQAGPLGIDVTCRWGHSPLGDPYYVVADLDAYHAWCVQQGLEVSMAPHATGVGGARLMQLAGPGGVRVYVLGHSDKE